MPLIKKEFVSRLKERSDVVEVLSDYLPLKKKGNEFECCCPFHNEKTPSFKVSPERQRFKCFGCGKTGDALQFLIDKGLGYVEAVETLAARYGMTVEYEKTNQSKEEIIRAKDNYEQGIELLEQICRYFQNSLQQSQVAKDYLKNRGLGEEIIKEFRIGFSPDRYDFKALSSIFKTELLEQVGAIRTNERGSYPFFRGRIMFPIFNVKGKVIAFGARFIGSEEERKKLETGKYINSPETRWFKKGDELYGLFNALKSPDKKREEVVVCEGYADVVQMHQQGIKNSVAALGTAFGEEHLRKLSKYYSSINFCFDADEAGRKAAVRTLEIIFKNFDERKFYKFTFLANRENPEEKEDPDSFLRKYGAEELRKELDNGFSESKFLEEILDIKNLKNIEDVSLKTKKDKEIKKWLSYISDDNHKAITYKKNLRKRLQEFGFTDIDGNSDVFFNEFRSHLSNNEKSEDLENLKNLEALSIDEKSFEKIKKDFEKKEEYIILYLINYPQFHNFEVFKTYYSYIIKYCDFLYEILHLCRCGADKEFFKVFLSEVKNKTFLYDKMDKLALHFTQEKIEKEIKDFFEGLVNEVKKQAKKVEIGKS